MDLSYPIGKFDRETPITLEMRADWIDVLAAAPAAFRDAVRGWNDRQLDTPYRPGGWTVRRLIHHVADSHMNSYIRFRLALTEESPVIKPYDQEKWAELIDARSMPIEPSLAVIEGMHARWVVLLRDFSAREFDRTFVHPEAGILRLDQALGLYAWHSRHHCAHIIGLRRREGW